MWTLQAALAIKTRNVRDREDWLDAMKKLGAAELHTRKRSMKDQASKDVTWLLQSLFPEGRPNDILH